MKKVLATEIKVTSIEETIGRRAGACQLEIHEQREEQNMHATYFAVTGCLVMATRPDASLTRVFAKEVMVQPVAREIADRILGSASGLVVSMLSNTALESDVVDYPTSSGLHFKWHSCAAQYIQLLAMLLLSYPASKRAKVRRPHPVLGARGDLGNQR